MTAVSSKRLRWALLCAACGTNPDVPEPTQSGRHVVVGADAGLEICQGSLEHMDRFTEAIAELFGVLPPTGSERIHFYWLHDLGFSERSGCAEVFTGCAFEHTTFSKRVPFNHELVHNVASTIGSPPPFFVEGLAVAYQGFEDEVSLSYIRPSGQDVRELLTLSGVDLFNHRDGYTTAGGFTAFLIDEYGIEPFLAVYARLESDASSPQIDEVFRATFGASLEEVILEFEDQRISCPRGAFDARVMECDAPKATWDGGRVELYRMLSCGQEDAVGPYNGASAVATYVVEVPESGVYELRAAATGSAWISLDLCGDCSRLAQMSLSAGQPPVTARLEAGRYSLRLIGPADRGTGLAVQLERLNEP